MSKHTLIIGGTGMLLDASCVLASRCEVLSSIARTEYSLSSLNHYIKKHKAKHHMLRLDWLDEFQFVQSIGSHVDAVGYPSLVLAWLHNDCLMHEIVSMLYKHNRHCHFFQVLGSAAASPKNNAQSLLNEMPKNVYYRQIILGFHVEESVSRWLSNKEISAGVVSAIDNPKRVSVVGQVEPWSLRP